MAFRGNGTREALGTARRAAGGAVLFVVAVGTLAAFLRHGVASRVALDSYAPPMIPPPRKGGSAEGASRSGAGAGESHEYAGRPTDWRRKQETGRHPNEANVGVDENTDALENLLKAAGGGQILDPGTAAARVQAAREEAGEVMDERRDEVAEEEMETPSGRSCCGGMGPEVRAALFFLNLRCTPPPCSSQAASLNWKRFTNGR